MIGNILLAVYLILVALVHLGVTAIPAVVLGIVALLAAILLLVGR